MGDCVFLQKRFLLTMLLSVSSVFPVLAADGGNLFFRENGVKIADVSSSYWDIHGFVPSLAEMQQNGTTVPDYVWCTADNAPFPHHVLFEFPAPQWITTLVFNNAVKEEDAYPGISARNIEVWVSNTSADSMKKIAAFELESNKNAQPIKIEPVEARWLKLVVTSNWGNETWTELNAPAVYDDGSRPADFAAQLREFGKVDVYGLYFDFGSASLRPESKPVLDAMLKYLMDNPAQTLMIEGHTDNVGSVEANLALSKRRAESVLNALVEAGADRARLQSEGYGLHHPVTANDTEQGRALNRRVTVRIVE